jgi:hypothetical protein
VLSAAGIQVIPGVSGKVQDAIQAYISGQFQPSSQPTVGVHAGMNYGGGMGGGMGMGRGMGRGMGMGGGRGAGRVPLVSPTPQQVSPEQELEELKNQSEMLAQQLSEIQGRIEELEKKKK